MVSSVAKRDEAQLLINYERKFSYNNETFLFIFSFATLNDTAASFKNARASSFVLSVQ